MAPIWRSSPMFTGLIEEVGTVAMVRHGRGASRLALNAPLIGPGCTLGDSVCINGVCLTVVAVAGSRLEFDAVAETLRRSNLGELRAGDAVNLERAMAAGSRFGGHIVQGHVDAVGRVAQITPEANSHLVTVEASPELLGYVVEKGSIAIDGISLTVATVGPTTFTVAIIPHTWSATTLSRRRAGDRVNLEADILAKYVERLLTARFGAPSRCGLGREPEATDVGSGLTEASLRDNGFA
jgi:riboflavin synthase